MERVLEVAEDLRLVTELLNPDTSTTDDALSALMPCTFASYSLPKLGP